MNTNNFLKSLLVAGVLLSASQAAAQSATTATPPAFAINSTSPVCSDGSEKQKACVTLSDKAAIKKVDIYFLFDDTGSFAGFVPTVTSIFSGVVGGLEAALPEVEFGFGVGRFEDFGGPGNGYSGEDSNGRPFTLNQPIITAATAGGAANRDTLINAALNREAPGYGGDGPETAIAEGLYQTAVGDGFDGDGDGQTAGTGGAQPAGLVATQTASDNSGDVPAFSTLDPSVLKSGTVGGAGFRSDALKLVIIATDICSVAAFDPSQPIPTTITGTGGTEAVTEFACAGLEAGNNRFGFVGDSKDESTNTVLGAVAPSGSHTVPQTIAALNAQGIRVLGMVPGSSESGAESVDALIGAGGASVPKGSGPSFQPAPFLSAVARLTNGVDSDGNPLVFFIGDGGEVLKNNLVAAVLAAAAKPVDVSVRAADLTTTSLSASGDPTVVPKVGPGQQACFDVNFVSGGAISSSVFNLDFFDVSSNLSLVKAPVTVNCVAPAVSCTGTDISGDQNLLDGGSLEQRNLVVRAAKRLEKFGGRARAHAKSYAQQAEALYLKNWTTIYTLPASVQSCTESSLCVSSSNAPVLDSYKSNSVKLRDLLNKVVKELKAHGNDAKDSKRRTNNASKLHKKNLATLKKIPTTNTSCSQEIPS